MSMSVQVTTLANGLRIATDYLSTVETASVGAWVAVGPRHEKPELNGISHLLEHLAFKGTKRRSALAIAEEIEAVGGHLNAYTSRENTAYFAKVLKEDVALAVDIIADILQHATMEPEELERERQVVIQEIHQSYDTPDDIIFDHFQETAYPDQAIGRPVLGEASLIEGVARETVIDYMKGQYSASKIVVAAAGNVDHEVFVKLAEAAFCDLPEEGIVTNEPTHYRGGEYREARELEQVHVVMGLEGIAYKDPDYYPMSVLSTLLGGGMSSRLFQEIREKRGLVYSIYSFASSFEDGGIFGVYAGTGRNEVTELIPVMCDEIQKLTSSVGEDELARARAQLKAATLMTLESTASRSEQVARQLQIFDRVVPIEEVIGEIEKVDAAAVQRTVKRMIESQPTFAAIGPIDKVEDFDTLMARLN
ncbi:MAG: insulinase family protein [Rhodospirillaceae bacterium]|nr:insulinase family protein [Rhodospirillaceae bacterium]